MESIRNHINKFKTYEAFDAFFNEAMSLETNLSRHLTYNHCETLYLFVNEDTGHIITWYRQGEAAGMILDAHYHLYTKIPWQIRGSA